MKLDWNIRYRLTNFLKKLSENHVIQNLKNIQEAVKIILKEEDESIRKAIQELENLNQKYANNPVLIWLLATCYGQGIGTPRDVNKAVEYYRLAAQHSYAAAQFDLGVFYAKGIGVLQNDKQAFEYFELAAKHGDVNAQFALGNCYDNGIGVSTDVKKAFEYFERAAKQGDATQFSLVVDYVKGKGLLKRALEYFTLVDKQEDVKASQDKSPPKQSSQIGITSNISSDLVIENNNSSHCTFNSSNSSSSSSSSSQSNSSGLSFSHGSSSSSSASTGTSGNFTNEEVLEAIPPKQANRLLDNISSKIIYVPQGYGAQLMEATRSYDIHGIYTDNFSSAVIVVCLGQKKISLSQVEILTEHNKVKEQIEWTADPFCEVIIIARKTGDIVKNPLLEYLTKKMPGQKVVTKVMNDQSDGVCVSFDALPIGNLIHSKIRIFRIGEKPQHLIHHPQEQQFLTVQKIESIIGQRARYKTKMARKKEFFIFEGRAWEPFTSELEVYASHEITKEEMNFFDKNDPYVVIAGKLLGLILEIKKYGILLEGDPKNFVSEVAKYLEDYLNRYDHELLFKRNLNDVINSPELNQDPHSQQDKVFQKQLNGLLSKSGIFYRDICQEIEKYRVNTPPTEFKKQFLSEYETFKKHYEFRECYNFFKEEYRKIKAEAVKLNKEAIKYYKQNMYPKASSLFLESLKKLTQVCLKSEPELANVYYNLGKCLLAMREYETTVFFLKTSLILKQHYTTPKPKAKEIEKITTALKECQEQQKQYASSAQHRIMPIFKIEWYENFFKQGLMYEDLKRYAEALIFFGFALKCQPNCRETKLKIENIIVSLNNGYQKEKASGVIIYNEKIFRPIICRTDYLESLAALKMESEAANLDFVDQIELIVKLIHFIEKFYTINSFPSAFINPEFLGESSLAVKLRLAKVGNEIVKRLGKILFENVQEVDLFVSYLDKDSQEIIKIVNDDIYFEDAKRVLRMIFEIIHKFPREKRGELIKILPWGKNSWYLFDFCGAVFDEDDTIDRVNAQGGISLMPYGFEGDVQKQKQLALYHNSINRHVLITKIAILDIIKTDIPIIKIFFYDLLKNKGTLKRNNILMIDKMGKLPNLRNLLWYTKQTYNIYRLLCLLPAVPGNSDTDIKAIQGMGLKSGDNLHELVDIVEYFKTRKLRDGLEDYRESMFSDLKHLTRLLNRKTATLTQLHNWGWIEGFSKISYGVEAQNSNLSDFVVGNNNLPIPISKRLMLSSATNYLNFNTLKGRCAFLRKLQLVGETFSPKNWGNHLKYITVIDPNVFYSIRNGLTHIEDHQYHQSIERLESDPHTLKLAFRELQTLKEEMYEVIIDRQNKFSEWPSDAELKLGIDRTWQVFAKKYWESVKNIYSIKPEMDYANYISSKQLLKPEETKQIKLHVNGEHYKQIEEMFLGKCPLMDVEAFRKLINPMVTKKIKKNILKLYAMAEKTNTRYINEEKEKRKKELSPSKKEIGKIRSENMIAHYPNIQQLVQFFWGAEDKEKGSPNPEKIFNLLKNRIQLLISLIGESKIPLEDKKSLQEALNQHLLRDMALLLSASYVLGQTIGLLNKLYMMVDLDVISRGIKNRLEHYVAVRNVLEHTDPILESVDLPYFSMVSDLPKIMSVTIGELIFDYKEFLNYDPKNLSPRIKNNDDRLKQAAALNPIHYQFGSTNSLKHAEEEVLEDENSDITFKTLFSSNWFLHLCALGDAAIKKTYERDSSLLQAKDWFGNTPLIHAVKGIHVNIIEFLAKRIDIDHQNKNGDTALIVAVKDFNGLVRNKPHYRPHTFQSNTNDLKEIISILIKEWSNKDLSNNQGESALKILEKLKSDLLSIALDHTDIKAVDEILKIISTIPSGDFVPKSLIFSFNSSHVSGSPKQNQENSLKKAMVNYGKPLKEGIDGSIEGELLQEAIEKSLKTMPLGGYETLPDGNCAFNAVSLGVCHLITQGTLSKSVCDRLKQALKLEQELKTWVENQSKENQQRKIAPILRAWAMKDIQDSYPLYQPEFQNGLCAALDLFINGQGNMDDTFIVHPDIAKKFKELKEEYRSENEKAKMEDEKINNLNIIKEKLVKWWGEKGKDLYITNLNKSAEYPLQKERWGGPIEIGCLAFILGVNITFIKDNCEPQLLGSEYGFVENLTPEEQRQLNELEVGAKYRNGFKIGVKNKKELEEIIGRQSLSEEERKIVFDENHRKTILEFACGNHQVTIAGIQDMKVFVEKIRLLGVFRSPRLKSNEELKKLEHDPNIKQFIAFRTEIVKCINRCNRGIPSNKDQQIYESLLKNKLIQKPPLGSEYITLDGIERLTRAVPENVKKNVLDHHNNHIPSFSIEHIGAHWSYLPGKEIVDKSSGSASMPASSLSSNSSSSSSSSSSSNSNHPPSKSVVDSSDRKDEKRNSR